VYEGGEKKVEDAEKKVKKRRNLDVEVFGRQVVERLCNRLHNGYVIGYVDGKKGRMRM